MGQMRLRWGRWHPGSCTHGGRVGISSSAVPTQESPLTAVRHPTSPGQVHSIHPPSSINWVLSACRVQQFITSIWGGHCVQFRSPCLCQLRPMTYCLGQWPESWHLAPLPSGVESGGAVSTGQATGRLAGIPGQGRTSGITTSLSLASLTIHYLTLNLDALGFLNLNFYWHNIPSFLNFNFLLILSVPRGDRY